MVNEKSKSCKSDFIIEELREYMKLLPWSLQRINDKRLLIYVLSRVVAKEFGLEELVIEFQK